VTVRDRDSLAQERVAIDALGEEFERRLRLPWKSPKLDV
jgi:glycyl-tRNA synthetase (class II)